MSHFDNQSTRQEQERQHLAFDHATLDGVDDGLCSRGYPLPACWYKPVYLLTARERGLIFGFWLQAWLRGSE